MLPLHEREVRPTTAADAKLNCVWDQSDIGAVTLSNDWFNYAYDVELQVSAHTHGGLHVVDAPDKGRVQVLSCLPGTPVAKIP